MIAFDTHLPCSSFQRPGGRVPALQIIVVDGKHTISQSKTIERYLARRLGLLGATEEEAAAIDAITEHVCAAGSRSWTSECSPSALSFALLLSNPEVLGSRTVTAVA